MELPYIDPVALKIGPLAIHWYGLTWLAALLMVWAGCAYQARRMPGWNDRHAEMLVFTGFVGAFLGGRLGYVLFYNPAYFLDNPLHVFSIWEGGMSFHGGITGCILGIILWARINDKSILTCLDLGALWVPLGIFSVRMGNFINGELWGRPTDMPWAMIFPLDPEQLPRHPSQLYEAMLEGILLFIVVQWVGRKYGPPGGIAGIVGSTFMIGYACARIVSEFFRQPDAHIGFDLFGWITRGQWLTLPILLTGVIGMIWILIAARQQPKQRT